MSLHFLIIEDEQDTFENLQRKLAIAHPEALVGVARNCDEGFDYIKKHRVSHPLSLLVLDLTFRKQLSGRVLKNGQALLRELKKNQYSFPIIIYSGHDDMEHIHPVMNNYEPQGYVVKTDNSSEELLFAIDRVLQGTVYYGQEIHKAQMQRYKYASNLDEIDEQIIQLMPELDSIKDWEGKVLKDNVPLSHKSIKKRIDALCDRLEVANEKQLVLKLQRMALLR